MSFLAPWALALGVAGAVGAVLLHLVALSRPAAFVLPTARFIPDRRSLVSRAASRPRDLLLLLLRVMLLVAAGAAFARPVFTGGTSARARVVLLDRSGLVADPVDAWRRARDAMGTDAPSILITFDSAARIVADLAAADSGARVAPDSLASSGSISSALAAARRAAGSVASDADSVELVLVSPVATEQLDAATASLRDLWPGGMRIERVALRAASADNVTLERPVALAHPLGPALARLEVSASSRSVRLVQGELSRDDRAFADAGGIVVVWDSSASALGAHGLSAGDEVIVAMLGRRSVPDTGRIVARWADGNAAAVERDAGRGCIRTVGVALPSSGDLPLQPGFGRIARGLFGPCRASSVATLASDVELAMLRGDGSAAPASALRDTDRAPSALVPWLIGIALLCALGELFVRARAVRDDGATT